MYSGGPKEAWGALWRNLANTIKPSICGGDVAFLSHYFDPLSAVVLWLKTAETRLRWHL